MPTRDELLARVSAARRRRNDAARELDEANGALQALEAAERKDVDPDDGAGDEVVHATGMRRVSVRG